MARDLNIFVCYHQSELVILCKPSVDYGDRLICLTNGQVRCNECLMEKIGTRESVGLCQQILWVMPS